MLPVAADDATVVPRHAARYWSSDCGRSDSADRPGRLEIQMPQTLAHRVDSLERKVESLEQLPDRVASLESQIVQLRDEMRAGFSSTRAEIKAGDEETRREIRALEETLRREMREMNTQMRVLHEDVIFRIALLGESNSRRKSVAQLRPDKPRRPKR